MKIVFEGKEVNVRELDFEIVKEHWNEYQLLDGGRVRIKLTITNIYRVLDESGQPMSNLDGTPNIITVSHNDITSRFR